MSGSPDRFATAGVSQLSAVFDVRSVPECKHRPVSPAVAGRRWSLLSADSVLQANCQGELTEAGCLSRCLDKVSVAKQKQMVTLARDATGRDPADGLAAVAALGGLLEVLEALHVERARRSGWSWEAIAQKLGVSRQAVHQKHGDLDKRKRRLGKRGR